jgi:hypothetical protein
LVLDFLKKIQNDHQVIYIKECINEEILTLVETMILNKLKNYQEKANRDRFILPPRKIYKYSR